MTSLRALLAVTGVAAACGGAFGQQFTGIIWNASFNCPGDADTWASGPTPVAGFTESRLASGAEGPTSGGSTVYLRCSAPGPMAGTHTVVIDCNAEAVRGLNSESVGANALAAMNVNVCSSSVSPTTYVRLVGRYDGAAPQGGQLSSCRTFITTVCPPPWVFATSTLLEASNTPRPSGGASAGVSVGIQLSGGSFPNYPPPGQGHMHGRMVLRFSTTGQPCIADLTALGSGVAGGEGAVTVDDLVFFLARFFADDIGVADLVGAGGDELPDDQVTVDDLVAFLSAFFAGYV